MEDHRLGDLLRELPREQARPGFTARVLRGIEEPGRRFSPRLALAGALALTVTVAAGVRVETRRDAVETARAQQALQEIRAEHGRLEREVQELSQPSVVYLGGNENVDLVLDLGRVRGTEGAKPAAYHDETY
jgi:LmbE family N-acetylglucosaminyl deacetylase